MKKLVLAIVLCLVFVPVFAATSSSGGVAVSPATALTGDNFHFNTLTYTYTATTNVVSGVIVGKIPTGWPAVAASAITMGGTAVEAKKAMTWTFAGSNYFGCTVTSANEGTVTFAMAVTIPATAGAYVFKFSEADFDANTYNAVELPGYVTVTVSSSSNPITWLSLSPDIAATPNILTTDVSKIVYTGQFSAAVSGGQMILNLDRGSNHGILASTNPSAVTWVAGALTSVRNNSIVINARAGVFGGSPTCNATQCVVAIGTAAAEETFEVIYGKPTATPDIGPQGTTYSDGLRIRFRSNAFFPASTVTPQALPTTFVNSKGNEGHLVMVPSATVVLTPSLNGESTVLNMSGFVKSHKRLVSSGGAVLGKGDWNSTGASYLFSPQDYGAYTLTGIIGWYDELNDNLYRTNTTNAVTLYKLPDLSDMDLAKANGFLTQEAFTASANAAADPLHVTIYAATQYFVDADFYGLSAAAFCRVVDGSLNTVSTFTIPSDGTFGTFDSGYVIAAEDVSTWYMQSAIPIEVNGILWRCSLPTR